MDREISLTVVYSISDYFWESNSISLTYTLASRNLDEPHKFTFMHPGNIVAYAILKAPLPAQAPSYTSKTKLPVMLCLHGSGLDVESHQAHHALDDVADLRAWVLLPTGGTDWCGDDWRKCF